MICFMVVLVPRFPNRGPDRKKGSWLENAGSHIRVEVVGGVANEHYKDVLMLAITSYKPRYEITVMH